MGGSREDVGGQLAWIESLSPWPAHFGLERMHVFLTDLGNPQRRYPAIHIVGTNGKTSTALMTAEYLRLHGLRAGVTISPHVRGWSERIQVDGSYADLECALARVRPYAAGATQFEVLIAAALAEFAASGVDVAVIEAGLGGRYDATNVLDAGVVVLTNVALEHTEILGDTREAIATEKLAVVSPGATVVIGEPDWEELALAAGAARVIIEAEGSNVELARAAAEAFLGRSIDPGSTVPVNVPGRLELRSSRPVEIWDGAHNLAGVSYLLRHLAPRRYTIVASILADKDAEAMLRLLATTGDTLIATRSANARSLAAEELARLAGAYFSKVEIEPTPARATARARALAGADGAILVTGSLYLLTELSLEA